MNCSIETTQLFRLKIDGAFTREELIAIREQINTALRKDDIRRNVTDIIIEIICEEFIINREQIMSYDKPHWLVWPRQIAMALCCELTEASTNSIKNLFNRKEHGTITYARDRVKYCEENDKREGASIGRIRAAVLSAIEAQRHKPIAPSDSGDSARDADQVAVIASNGHRTGLSGMVGPVQPMS